MVSYLKNFNNEKWKKIWDPFRTYLLNNAANPAQLSMMYYKAKTSVRITYNVRVLVSNFFIISKGFYPWSLVNISWFYWLWQSSKVFLIGGSGFLCGTSINVILIGIIKETWESLIYYVSTFFCQPQHFHEFFKHFSMFVLKISN